jgi:hypothetical protein
LSEDAKLDEEFLKMLGGGETSPQPIAEVKVEREDDKINWQLMVDKYLRKKGMASFNVIVFKLVTEYMDSSAVFKKSKEEGVVTEELRSLRRDPKEYRSLRSDFYAILHKIAWQDATGWILNHDADPKELDPLIKRLNTLNMLDSEKQGYTPDSRFIDIVEVYLPTEYATKSIARYINERKNAIGIRLQKVADNIRDAKAVAREVKELNELISNLEVEMKYLKKL